MKSTRRRPQALSQGILSDRALTDATPVTLEPNSDYWLDIAVIAGTETYQISLSGEYEIDGNRKAVDFKNEPSVTLTPLACPNPRSSKTFRFYDLDTAPKMIEGTCNPVLSSYMAGYVDISKASLQKIGEK